MQNIIKSNELILRKGRYWKTAKAEFIGTSGRGRDPKSVELIQKYKNLNFRVKLFKIATEYIFEHVHIHWSQKYLRKVTATFNGHK